MGRILKLASDHLQNFSPQHMSNKNVVADALRNKLMQTHIKTEAEKSEFPKIQEIGGIKYLHEEITSKIHNPIFHADLYEELGTKPPTATLIYGISGVGKKFIVHCYAKQHKVPVLTKYFTSPGEVRELYRKAQVSSNAIVLIEKLEDYEESPGIIHQINESIKSSGPSIFTVIIHKDKNTKINYDHDIFVKIPTLHERKDVLDWMLKRVLKEEIDTALLAQFTPGFVPKNLEKLLKMASTRAVHRGVLLDISPSVTMSDFEAALSDWKSLEKTVTFDDIGALEKVKEQMKISILLPSQFPAKFKRMGIHRPSGILLYGPPGCGKTLIAKAVSNMSHCNFLSIKGPELITKYVGDSEKHLRDLFEKAKNLSPCVLFFDEIDSLCGKRGKNEFGNRIVNQILTLLDGIEDRGEVYLIGATNRPHNIDKALLRPGRFDTIIEVPIPSKNEGLEIFRKCVSKIPCENFDFTELGLDNFTGAEISGIVKEAAMLCLKDNFNHETPVVTRGYFIQAIEKIAYMKIEKGLFHSSDE